MPPKPLNLALDKVNENQDTTSSWKVSDKGSLQLFTNSHRAYDFTEKGLSTKQDGSEQGHFQISADEVIELSTLGYGASGCVKTSVHVPTNRLVALKQMHVSEHEKRKQVIGEIKWLTELPEVQETKSLVRFHGAFLAERASQVKVALEFVACGTIESHVKLVGTVPERILSAWSRHLLEGFDYLHRLCHVIHRDIKPSNILLTLSGEPRLSDFGLAAGLTNTADVRQSFHGTMCYMSPERVQNLEYSYSSDLWSLGLTLYEAATGKFPYDADTSKGPFQLLLQICKDPPPGLEHDNGSGLKQMISSMLIKEPERRPWASELLGFKFIENHSGVCQSDLAAYMRSAVDLSDKVNEIASAFTEYYYKYVLSSKTEASALQSLCDSSATLKLNGKIETGPKAVAQALKAKEGDGYEIEHVDSHLISSDCQCTINIMASGTKRSRGGKSTPISDRFMVAFEEESGNMKLMSQMRWAEC